MHSLMQEKRKIKRLITGIIVVYKKKIILSELGFNLYNWYLFIYNQRKKTYGLDIN
jgi:hypothetical protein